MAWRRQSRRQARAPRAAPSIPSRMTATSTSGPCGPDCSCSSAIPATSSFRSATRARSSSTAAPDTLADKTLAQIRQLSDKPIQFIANTGFQPEHTGGNVALRASGADPSVRGSFFALQFADAGVGATIMAHQNVQNRMTTRETAGRGHPERHLSAGASPHVSQRRRDRAVLGAERGYRRRQHRSFPARRRHRRRRCLHYHAVSVD